MTILDFSSQKDPVNSLQSLITHHRWSAGNLRERFIHSPIGAALERARDGGRAGRAARVVAAAAARGLARGAAGLYRFLHRDQPGRRARQEHYKVDR